MAEQWYYTRNKQQVGPVSMEQVRQLALAGQLQPTDLVWKDGMAQWTPANQIAGLFGQPQAGFTVAPPPVPVARFMNFLDLDFTCFVTTVIVKWIWRIWLILIGAGLVVVIVQILWELPVLKAILAFVAALFVVAFWTLLVRLWLETIAVIFRIAEYLRDMSTRNK